MCVVPDFKAKMPTRTADLPDPKDLSYLFSRTTQARAASSIKKFYKYFSIPGIGQLAGGKNSRIPVYRTSSPLRRCLSHLHPI
jgi:hypothetical protein